MDPPTFFFQYIAPTAIMYLVFAFALHIRDAYQAAKEKLKNRQSEKVAKIKIHPKNSKEPSNVVAFCFKSKDIEIDGQKMPNIIGGVVIKNAKIEFNNDENNRGRVTLNVGNSPKNIVMEKVCLVPIKQNIVNVIQLELEQPEDIPIEDVIVKK